MCIHGIVYIRHANVRHGWTDFDFPDRLDLKTFQIADKIRSNLGYFRLALPRSVTHGWCCTAGNTEGSTSIVMQIHFIAFVFKFYFYRVSLVFQTTNCLS